jgi:coenzyme PQQ synthesis protein D (PqqD)
MKGAPMLESRIRVNEDVLSQELNGEAVLLNLKTGVYFGLDAVGTRVWQLFSDRKGVAQVLDALVAEYEVPRERCAQDLVALITKLQDHGLVTLSDKA